MVTEFPYAGESKLGKKCMKCKGCGKIQEHAFWYDKKNAHWCEYCDSWKEMTNLDNEEFNPSRRY